MTTHEALELQPYTLVHWLPPEGINPGDYSGVAQKSNDSTIRVVWDDLAEPDSIISKNDRRMLAAVAITVHKTDANLDDE